MKQKNVEDILEELTIELIKDLYECSASESLQKLILENLTKKLIKEYITYSLSLILREKIDKIVESNKEFAFYVLKIVKTLLDDKSNVVECAIDRIRYIIRTYPIFIFSDLMIDIQSELETYLENSIGSYDIKSVRQAAFDLLLTITVNQFKVISEPYTYKDIYNCITTLNEKFVEKLLKQYARKE
jgi:hypothetical protein